MPYCAGNRYGRGAAKNTGTVSLWGSPVIHSYCWEQTGQRRVIEVYNSDGRPHGLVWRACSSPSSTGALHLIHSLYCDIGYSLPTYCLFCYSSHTNRGGVITRRTFPTRGKWRSIRHQRFGTGIMGKHGAILCERSYDRWAGEVLPGWLWLRQPIQAE